MQNVNNSFVNFFMSVGVINPLIMKRFKYTSIQSDNKIPNSPIYIIEALLFNIYVVLKLILKVHIRNYRASGRKPIGDSESHGLSEGVLLFSYYN